MLTAAANVALPRRARTTFTWLPFGLTPPHPSPIRPSRAAVTPAPERRATPHPSAAARRRGRSRRGEAGARSGGRGGAPPCGRDRESSRSHVLVATNRRGTRA